MSGIQVKSNSITESWLYQETVKKKDPILFDEDFQLNMDEECRIVIKKDKSVLNPSKISNILYITIKIDKGFINESN